MEAPLHVCHDEGRSVCVTMKECQPEGTPTAKEDEHVEKVAHAQRLINEHGPGKTEKRPVVRENENVAVRVRQI